MRALAIASLLLLAGCSFDAETPSIFVTVDGIPQAADHLDVTVTSSDSSVQPKMYRPSFQPVDPSQPLRSVALAMSAPSATGTVTVLVVAADRNCPTPCTGGLANGTQTSNEPAAGSTINLEIALK
jgi:hypothetical protein